VPISRPRRSSSLPAASAAADVGRVHQARLQGGGVGLRALGLLQELCSPCSDGRMVRLWGVICQRRRKARHRRIGKDAFYARRRPGGSGDGT
jgi:hypothetical protein